MQYVRNNNVVVERGVHYYSSVPHRAAQCGVRCVLARARAHTRGVGQARVHTTRTHARIHDTHGTTSLLAWRARVWSPVSSTCVAGPMPPWVGNRRPSGLRPSPSPARRRNRRRRRRTILSSETTTPPPLPPDRCVRPRYRLTPSSTSHSAGQVVFSLLLIRTLFLFHSSFLINTLRGARPPRESAILSRADCLHILF